jgi:hypothetical protein
MAQPMYCKLCQTACAGNTRIRTSGVSKPNKLDEISLKQMRYKLRSTTHISPIAGKP